MSRYDPNRDRWEAVGDWLLLAAIAAAFLAVSIYVNR